mgnify:CR=1 FL=1
MSAVSAHRARPQKQATERSHSAGPPATVRRVKQRLTLKLLKTRDFGNGSVVLHYEPVAWTKVTRRRYRRSYA